jgi:ribosomal protein L37AE/L43A
MMNLRKQMDHGPKTCQHCYDKTAHGRYVPITKLHQAWFCERCAPKFEQEKK